MMNAENILPTHTVMLTYFTEINVCGASLCLKTLSNFVFSSDQKPLGKAENEQKIKK